MCRERERDTHGDYLSFVEAQLEAAFLVFQKNLCPT